MGAKAHPFFEQYGEDLARQMTDWLYDDPSITAGKHIKGWETSAAWVDFKSVSFLVEPDPFNPAGIATGGVAVSINFLMNGGRNCLVFSRMATVANFALATTNQLPNDIDAQVDIRMRTESGMEIVQEAPLCNSWGAAPGLPYVLPQPRFLYGRDIQNVRVTNVNSGVTIEARVAFLIAVLNTGR